MVEAKGIPIAITVTGANIPDCKEIEAVLDAIPDTLPAPDWYAPQHICADKGYDSAAVRKALEDRNYTPHIRSRGEEIADKAQDPEHQNRRWVCERTHSWINRNRRLLIRWEKKLQNYLGFLHLAAAFITWRHSLELR